MTNNIDPKHPLLQIWLDEGLSLETHTIDHPCPLLQGQDFDKAKSTFDRCVDQLSEVPNSEPVAFRFPCCDSQNTPSPRAFAEILNRTTSKGGFLQIDTSVVVLLTSDDAALPKDLTKDEAGDERFGAYLPFPSFVNKVKNYPYPFVIGGKIWEFPIAVPDDWQGQKRQGPKNQKTVDDLKAVIDATVIKQGTANVVFHPHGWLTSDQIVEVIDHIDRKYDEKVLFLTFAECLERLNRNLLGGQPLRNAEGGDNGVRILDINGDGYVDVLIGNESKQVTRIWSPDQNKWREFGFPTRLAPTRHIPMKSVPGHPPDRGVRFGIVRPGGKVSMWVHNELEQGAWTWSDDGWTSDSRLLVAMNDPKVRLWTSLDESDTGIRFRDIDGDGVCELIAAGFNHRGILRWNEPNGVWYKLPFDLPEWVSVTDRLGHDAGTRFWDIDGDGQLDVIFSDQNRYGLYLFESMEKGWNKKILSRQRDKERDKEQAIPMITRNGTNNGAWQAERHLWIQNEDTSKMPDGVDRRSFQDLLDGTESKP